MHRTLVLSIFLLHSNTLHDEMITEWFCEFDGPLDHDLSKSTLHNKFSKGSLTFLHDFEKKTDRHSNF